MEAGEVDVLSLMLVLLFLAASLAVTEMCDRLAGEPDVGGQRQFGEERP